MFPFFRFFFLCTLRHLTSAEGGVALSNLRVVLPQGVIYLGSKYFQSILKVSCAIFLTKMRFRPKIAIFALLTRPLPV